jgi:antibiotic biosynthesis monooxygenase (ABM) superfamily enzyme
MIMRYWRGWATPGNAAAYERVAREEILPSFAARGLSGYRGSYLLRRHAGEEIEYAVIMIFDSVDAVRGFAGEDYEAAYVPAQVQEVLTRFDERSAHYEVLVTPPETTK